MNKYIILKGCKRGKFVAVCSYGPKGRGRITVETDGDESLDAKLEEFFSIPDDVPALARDLAIGILSKRSDVDIRSIDVAQSGDMLINVLAGGDLYSFVVRKSFRFYIYDGDLTPHKYVVDYSTERVRVLAHELSEANDWVATSELIVDENGTRIVEMRSK